MTNNSVTRESVHQHLRATFNALPILPQNSIVVDANSDRTFLDEHVVSYTESLSLKTSICVCTVSGLRLALVSFPVKQDDESSEAVTSLISTCNSLVKNSSIKKIRFVLPVVALVVWEEHDEERFRKSDDDNYDEKQIVKVGALISCYSPLLRKFACALDVFSVRKIDGTPVDESDEGEIWKSCLGYSAVSAPHHHAVYQMNQILIKPKSHPDGDIQHHYIASRLFFNANHEAATSAVAVLLAEILIGNGSTTLFVSVLADRSQLDQHQPNCSNDMRWLLDNNEKMLYPWSRIHLDEILILHANQIRSERSLRALTDSDLVRMKIAHDCLTRIRHMFPPTTALAVFSPSTPTEQEQEEHVSAAANKSYKFF